MITFLIAATASAISVGATVLSWRKAFQAQRTAARHVLDAEQHSNTAQCAASAASVHSKTALAHSETASRAALASKTHAAVSLSHAESAKKAAKQPSAIDCGTFDSDAAAVAPPEPPKPKMTRREMIAANANSSENLARVAEIDEHRARTSPLIPPDPLAQSDPTEFRRRFNKIK
jgi:hypothetical protein